MLGNSCLDLLKRAANQKIRAVRCWGLPAAELDRHAGRLAAML
jgi:hypothetical protein